MTSTVAHLASRCPQRGRVHASAAGHDPSPALFSPIIYPLPPCACDSRAHEVGLFDSLASKRLEFHAPPTSAPAPAPAPAPEPAAEPMGLPMLSRSNRESVDWYAGLAADGGAVQRVPSETLPSMAEEAEDVPDVVPQIQVEGSDESAMADVDMGTGMSCTALSGQRSALIHCAEYRVRSLYAYEAQRPEELSEFPLVSHTRLTLTNSVRLWRESHPDRASVQVRR